MPRMHGPVAEAAGCNAVYGVGPDVVERKSAISMQVDFSIMEAKEILPNGVGRLVAGLFRRKHQRRGVLVRIALNARLLGLGKQMIVEFLLEAIRAFQIDADTGMPVADYRCRQRRAVRDAAGDALGPCRYAPVPCYRTSTPTKQHLRLVSAVPAARKAKLTTCRHAVHLGSLALMQGVSIVLYCAHHEHHRLFDHTLEPRQICFQEVPVCGVDASPLIFTTGGSSRRMAHGEARNKTHTMTNVILLNGCSSAGKTTLAQTLQQMLPQPWQHVAFDQFRDGLPMRARGLNAPPGTDGARGLNVVPASADGQPVTHIRLGDFGEAVLDGMRACVASLAQNGVPVIVDDLLLRREYLTAYAEVLNPASTWLVGVYCDLEQVNAREQRRQGRFPGTALAHFEQVHDHGVSYDIAVDTSIATPRAVAAEIIARLETPPQALASLRTR